MKLKLVRIISVLPIILALLTAGCEATEYPVGHPVLGVLMLVFVIVTTASLFLLKQWLFRSKPLFLTLNSSLYAINMEIRES